MHKQMLSLTIGLSLALAGGTALAQQAATDSGRTVETTTVTTRSTQPAGALSETQIKQAIAEAGYKEVKDLEFDNGVWEADARGGNDDWVDLRVGPVSGKVYPAKAPSKLNADEVKAKLAAAGYQNVKDVEFDDGLWSADAETGTGANIDLLVDPDDGSVVAETDD